MTSSAALKSHGKAIALLSTWLDKRRGERPITHGNAKSPGVDKLLKHWIPSGLASLHGVNWTVTGDGRKAFPSPICKMCLIPCNPFTILSVVGFCVEEHGLLWGSYCVAPNLGGPVSLRILVEAAPHSCKSLVLYLLAKLWNRGEHPTVQRGLVLLGLDPSAFLASVL